MTPDVPLSATLVLDRLGHLELAQKRLGAINEAGGVRLTIVEVMRMVNESRPKPVDVEISLLAVRLM